MAIKHSIEELQQIILVAEMGVVDNPSPLIIELAQQLIDVQTRLRKEIPETMIRVPDWDTTDIDLDALPEPGLYNTYITGKDLTTEWNAYIDGFFQPKQ